MIGGKSQPATVLPLIFNDRAVSQSSMTRTMSVNDQSLVVTPAAIALLRGLQQEFRHRALFQGRPVFSLLSNTRRWISRKLR